MNNTQLPPWKYILLALLTLAMIASYVMMTGQDHFTRQAIEYLRYFAAAFLLYLVAVWLSWRVELMDSRTLLIGVMAAALLMRAPLWFTEPSLSTDVWRYLWDGHVLTQGMNPYAERVDSPAFDSLESSIRSRVQHQWMASPYPPVAQFTFSGVYSLAPNSPTAMQVVFSLFDLATGAFLILLLKRLKLPTGRALLYLWNPLIVVEFAHSAHLDSLVTLLVVLALLWSLAGRQTASMIALVLATLTKLIPVLLLPAFIRRWGWKRTLAFGLLAAASYLPFLGAGFGLTKKSDGTGIFGAARIYSLQWKTNDGLFYWLVEGFEQIGASEPFNLAKLIGALVLAALAAWILLRDSPGSEPSSRVISHSALLISAYLLLSAAMFPWYLTWLLALLPLLPGPRERAWWPFLAGWIYFSAAVNLSYLFYLDPVNPREIQWVRQAEYLPLFALLCLGSILWVWNGWRPRKKQAGG